MIKVSLPGDIAGDDSIATDTSSSIGYEDDQNDNSYCNKKEKVVTKLTLEDEKKDSKEDVHDYWFEPPIVARPPKGAQHGR